MAIDPGNKGAICLASAINGKIEKVSFQEMPLSEEGINYFKVKELIGLLAPEHIFLERALPMAMGAKHAFNYGRGFAALEIAISEAGKPVTYVEPSKWHKAILDGIDTRLKPKERSLIGVKRLFPRIWITIPATPKSKRPHDGMVDALLIAEYGRRKMGSSASEQISVADF